MKSIIVIGYEGRMAQEVRTILQERGLSYRIYSPKAPKEIRAENFKDSAGVIDFSNPSASRNIAQMVSEAGVPWVCGTTGWSSDSEKFEILNIAAKNAPVLYDSNFSFGVEILCRASETLAEALPGPFFIVDYHHAKKKDAPSGTALKISKRMKEKNAQAHIEFRDIRAGNIAGEHQIFISWENESLQFTHRAHSRKVFAEGALRALEWLQTQAPGLYGMRDLK